MALSRNPKDGYIFYDNLGEFGNEYWAYIRDGAENYFAQVEIPHAEVNNAITYLRGIARSEFEKEKKVLIEIFGCDIPPNLLEDYGTLLRAMNEAINIEGAWKRVLTRLRAAELGGKEEKKRLRERGTVLASTYGSYLQTRLSNSLINFFNSAKFTNALMNGDDTTIEKEFNSLVDRAMTRALDDMLHANDTNLKEDQSTPWLEAFEVLNKTKKFRQQFNIRLYSMFGFDEVNAQILKQMREDILNERVEGRNFSARVRKSVDMKFGAKLSGKVSQQIAGYVAEELGQLFAATGAHKNGIKWSSTSTKNTGFNTDVVAIASPNQILKSDISVVFDTTTVTNKTTAAKAMERFYEKISAIQKEKAIIYESTKKYNLGDTFKGFSGTSYNLTSFKELLYRIDYLHIEAFVNKILNTMPGALYANDSQFIQEASRSIALEMAYMLFDDYTTIGNAATGNTTAIHVFRLSDIVVPLSYLLNKMADAMVDTISNIDRYAKVKVNLPSSLLYKNYPMKDKSAEASEERWLRQRDVMQQVTFNIDFLSNFKDLLMGDIENILK